MGWPRYAIERNFKRTHPRLQVDRWTAARGKELRPRVALRGDLQGSTRLHRRARAEPDPGVHDRRQVAAGHHGLSEHARAWLWRRRPGEGLTLRYHLQDGHVQGSAT